MKRVTLGRACLVGAVLGTLAATLGSERRADASGVYVELNSSQEVVEQPAASIAGVSGTTPSSPVIVGASGPRVTSPPNEVPTTSRTTPSTPASTLSGSSFVGGSADSFGRSPGSAGAFGSSFGSSPLGGSGFSTSSGTTTGGWGSFSR